MGKYDARNRGRFSNVGAPPRGMDKLGYVPVVKSSVLEQDDWRDMKRADVDPNWDEDAPADDLPLPDELAGADGDLPLPERTSSPEDLPLPDLSMTLGDDGDLPLPDLGSTVGDDGDLPLPRFETMAEEEGRVGLVPGAPELFAAARAQAPASQPVVRATFARPSAREPVFESQPVPVGARSSASGAPAFAQPEGTGRTSAPASAPAFSQPPGTGRMSVPAPATPSRRPAAWSESEVSTMSLPPMMSAPPAPAPAEFAPATTLSDAPSLASLRAAAEPLLSAPDNDAFAASPASAGQSGAVLFSALPDAGSDAAAARLQALVAAVDVAASAGDSVPPQLAAALVGNDVARPARSTGGDPTLSAPAAESSLGRSGSVPTAATPSAGFGPPARPPAVRPPPPPGVRASALPSDAERLAHGRALAEAGRRDDALALLEPLCAQQPENEACRALLLDVCCKLPRAAKALDHAEWLMVRWLQTQRPAEAAGVYRLVRATFPELALSERALVAAVEAADRSSDSQVVVDAAKLLVHGYPESAYVPRVLTKAAEQQLVSGRADLARSTLEYLATRYPHDPLAQQARQRLNELLGR